MLFLSKLFQSTHTLLSILAGFGATLLYYFIRKKAKLEVDNKTLKDALRDVKRQNGVLLIFCTLWVW